MSLKQDIKTNMVAAMKSGDNFVVGVLRMLSASVATKEKEKRYNIAKEKPEATDEDLAKLSELPDEEITSVIISEVKKRRDAIALYQQGGRQELADNEKREIEVLQKYLPEQLSGEELKKLVAESIEKVGAKEIKDMGRVMAELNPKIKGRADSAEVAKIIKEILSK